MSRLWLVRHARPLVASGLCYGRLDMPADPAASRQAAQALARALPPKVAAVRHSPLQRCELLALYLRALRPDLESDSEPRIQEMDFGTWEGRAWSAIDQAEIAAWADHLGSRAPGGGEPLSAMLTRVALALHDAAACAQARGGDVVWVTHAGVARCVQWLQTHGETRLPQAHEWPAEAPGFGAWAQVAL